MWKQVTALAAVAVVVVTGAWAASDAAAPTVRTIVHVRGQLAGLTQSHGSPIWCSDDHGTQTIHAGGRTYPASQHTKYGSRIWCLGGAPAFTWESAGGTIAFGGLEEVRCSDTHWTIYAVRENGLPHQVDTAAPECYGYGRQLVGIGSDGSDVLYATVNYAGDDLACQGDDKCSFRIEGGAVYRIVAGRRTRIPGLGASGAFAAGAGYVALAPPLAGGPYSFLNGPWPNIPSAKPGGIVSVRRSSDGALVSKVKPTAPLIALAVTSRYVVALTGSGLEWFDVESGAPRGSLSSVTTIGASELAASGTHAVYVRGSTLHLVDLETKSDSVLWHGAPLWPSIDGDTVMWGSPTAIFEAKP